MDSGNRQLNRDQQLGGGVRISSACLPFNVSDRIPKPVRGDAGNFMAGWKKEGKNCFCRSSAKRGALPPSLPCKTSSVIWLRSSQLMVCLRGSPWMHSTSNRNKAMILFCLMNGTKITFEKENRNSRAEFNKYYMFGRLYVQTSADADDLPRNIRTQVAGQE